MRIVVIGGTNFIGPYVLRSLVQLGHKVTIFHRGEHEPPLPREVQHIHSPRAGLPITYFPPELTRPKPDIVLHMFPVGEADSQAFMEAFRKKAGRVVAISSADVYRAYSVFLHLARGREPVPIAEDAPLRSELYIHKDMAPQLGNWANLYEKVVAERILTSYRELPATVLRLPVVYGPGDPMHRFFPYLKRMQDERPAIILGEKQAQWRWTHGFVEDVALAIVAAVLDERAARRIYNVGEPKTPSLEERLRSLADTIGWRGEIVRVAQRNLPPHLRDSFDYRQDLVCDTTLIRRELSYEEGTDYPVALRRTVEWQLAHAPKANGFDYSQEEASVARSSGL